MEYTKEELLEAKRQIDSTLHKLRATILTLQGKENPSDLLNHCNPAKQGEPGAVQVSGYTCPAPGESL